MSGDMVQRGGQQQQCAGRPCVAAEHIDRLVYRLDIGEFVLQFVPDVGDGVEVTGDECQRVFRAGWPAADQQCQFSQDRCGSRPGFRHAAATGGGGGVQQIICQLAVPWAEIAVAEVQHIQQCGTQSFWRCGVIHEFEQMQGHGFLSESSEDVEGGTGQIDMGPVPAGSCSRDCVAEKG